MTTLLAFSPYEGGKFFESTTSITRTTAPQFAFALAFDSTPFTDFSKSVIRASRRLSPDPTARRRTS
jgi:hypothetical protein